MRKWVLSVVVLAVIALAIPLSAYAGGWAGSRYDKSECTYTKESNFLFCQTTFTVETVMTAQMAIADEACPSGTRLLRRTGTFVEPWTVFDAFEGHTPHAKWNLFGNEAPLAGQEFWKDFTDTDLGCL
jgi:hypothetical protein